MSSIVKRMRNAKFPKYLFVLWKYLLTFLAKDLFLNFLLLNVLKVKSTYHAYCSRNFRVDGKLEKPKVYFDLDKHKCSSQIK